MKLELLGLNEYESKAYQAIVDLGESKSHQISAKSGVPYGRIYDVLNSLESKGLIKLVLKKPKTYNAIDPELILIKQIEKQISELEKLKEETKQMKRKYERFPEDAVFVVKGKENFHRLLSNETPTEKSGYNIKYTSEPHPNWMRQIKNAMKRGVDVKTLTRFDNETRDNLKKWLKIQKTIKEFPNEGVAMEIKDEKTVIIGLIKSDMTLVINDDAFGKMMANLFREAYKTSKEVKI
jgi:sugar-specific transcriptional regulator TrmB